MNDENIIEIEDELITIILVTNALSAFSALLMIASYYKFVELQTFAFKIVLFLNISDLFLAIGNIIILTPTAPSQYQSGVLCELQSYIINASQLSSIIWTAIIAYVLYQSCINRKTEDSMNIAIYVFFGYFLPLIFSLYPIFTGDYGFSGISCWIKLDVSNPERTTIIQFINFYAPLMIIILYNSLVYLVIICKLYGEMVHNQNKFIYKMLSYPLILIICWIFTAFNRTYTEITNEQHIWLLYISKTLSGLMGLFNYIGYGFTPQVMHSMYQFCCPRKDKTITLELEQQNNTDSQRNSVESQIKSSRGNSFINELI